MKGVGKPSRRRVTALAPVALLGVLIAGGCACCRATVDDGASSPPPRPAPISHIVLAKLKNPADAAELIRDCDARLAAIPSVASYACGRHIDTGRATVDGGYDVGLYIGFEDEAAYAAYVDHPSHVALVSDWAARTEWLRVHDVFDPTP